jgi:hypothetical protein
MHESWTEYSVSFNNNNAYLLLSYLAITYRSIGPHKGVPPSVLREVVTTAMTPAAL